MPRVSFSNDYLLGSPWCTVNNLSNCFDRYYRTSSSITELADNEQPTILSPNEIDEILSRKLINQLKTTSGLKNEDESSRQTSESLINTSTANTIDPELIALIDRFFHLTYMNTIPMVNLLATAVATNFLKENIRELDKKLQEEQTTHISMDIKRGTSLLYEPEDDDDDDNVSWASAPT